jgi:hypothetical protein
MDKQLRQDLLCEKTRTVQEIRIELAQLWRSRRWALSKQEYTLATTLLIRIETLNWVLRNEVSCEEWHNAGLVQ